MLSKEEIIKQVRPILETVSEIETAYLYGSYAEGFATERSDVDIAVEPIQGAETSDFDLAPIQENLSQMLGVTVQLTVLPKDKYLLFQHEVRSKGVVIFDKNPRRSLNNLIATMIDYFDFRSMYRYDQRERLQDYFRGLQT